jgi:protein tyrosine/serine phosphatase
MSAGRAAVSERHLDWDGCFNVRDLGGLPTRDGGVTRHGAVIRADALDELSAAGWEALVAHGVRTVVDLRNDDERARGDAAARPAVVTTVHVALDGSEDREFWDGWDSAPEFATPLYYRPHLDRFPERSVAALRAIARAAPGGVAFHCARGRDRSGQVAILLLALAGVTPEAIAADYALSGERLPALCAARGEDDDGAQLEAFLAQRGTTAQALVLALLADLDVEAHLRAAGLTEADVTALRDRLVAA